MIYDLVVSREYAYPLRDFNRDPSTQFADIQRVLRWLENRVSKRLREKASTAGIRKDDSQANPPASQADLQIVRTAQRIIDSATKWNRHDTRDCPAGAQTFSLYCALLEASDRVTGDLEQRGAAMQEVRFAVNTIAENRKYNHRLMDYNNDPTTEFADITKILHLTESRIQERLASGR